MRQKFKTVWDRVGQQLPAMNKLRGKSPQFMLLAMLACLMAILVVLFLWSSQGNYRPLYGQQERFDSAQIIAILDQESIPYRLMETTGQVLVEEDRLSQVRMLLAAKGVQAQLPVGLDILEQESALGTSQFVENARYRRGLEGELARTIMGLQGIDYARVHLAIPDRQIFLRGNEEQPSASVMLELTPTARMTPEQVLAVVNLIKGSVANLATDNISVVDQHGNLLTQDLSEELSGTKLTVHQLDYQKQVERGYERRVSEMLRPVLGASNYKVQVTAQLSFDAVEETRESLDESPIVREERLQKDSSQGGQLSGIPGALSNRPPVTDPQTPATQGNQQQAQPATAERLVNERDEQQRRYDVGRTITHTKYQQGRLSNLSVSVVLNQTVSPEKGWSAAQLSNIHQMVQDAVGFDQGRGDRLSLNVFPFSEDGINPALAGEWWQDPVLLIYARYLMGTILGLCLIFFVIRKLMQHLIQRTPLTGTEQPVVAQSPSGDSEGGEYFRKHHRNLAFDKVRLNELPDTNSPLQDKLAHLQLLADHDPKRVSEVLEQWMNSR